MLSIPRPPLPKHLLPPTPSLLSLLRTAESGIPFGLKKPLLERLLNRLFREQLADEEFDFLEGRQLGLEVKDMDLRLAFSYRDGRLEVCPATEPDAWIRGDAREFVHLATLEQDPDTLFFQRRLLIEGDTELGLAVKNLLDSVDWSEMPALFQRAVKLAGRVAH